MKNYNELEKLNEKYFTLQFLTELLEHDMITNMPIGSIDFRKAQLELIYQMKNEIMKDKNWSEIFNNCRANTNLSLEQKANIRETYNNWLTENSVPEELSSKLTKSCVNTTNLWLDIRNGKGEFKDILPYLEENFNITRKIAESKSKVLNLSPYDCLLTKFQSGLKSDMVDNIFNDLKPFLIDLSKKNYDKVQAVELCNNYDLDKKKRIVKKIAKIVGVDLNRARIDSILHPHSYGYSSDVLLGMNYNFDLMLMIKATLHECGHAVYLQNLKNYLQPIGQHRGMAIHESQSIIVEKQIGNNEKFIEYISKILIEEFGNLPELSIENILALNRMVKCNSIRFKADEITYPLHIILRYEIERGIIEEKIKIKDLPEIWNEKSKEYLGTKPENNNVGCLQDIHWMKGDIGYFPSYAIGTIISAQLMNTIKNNLLNLDNDLKNGDLSNIMNWLNKNIHSKGSLLSFEDLVKSATGEEISSKSFKEDLLEKYK